MNEFDNQQPPDQQEPPQYGQEPSQNEQEPTQYGQEQPQYEQVPPQYGQQPPQYGQVPPQYGQIPPQYGQVPPQYGQVPPQGYPNMQPYEPEEVRRWSWGAFCLGILYGIAHKSYLPLLLLIPYFNFVWIFICGAFGMRWAWKAGVEKGEYRPDELHVFLRVQRTWDRAGFVAFWITIAVVILYLIIIFSFISAASYSPIFSYYFSDLFGY